MRDPEGSHRGSQPIGREAGFVRPGYGRQDYELLAAKSKDRVTRSHRAREGPGDQAEDPPLVCVTSAKLLPLVHASLRPPPTARR
jgi:hypothetical protein